MLGTRFTLRNDIVNFACVQTAKEQAAVLGCLFGAGTPVGCVSCCGVVSLVFTALVLSCTTVALVLCLGGLFGHRLHFYILIPIRATIGSSDGVSLGKSLAKIFNPGVCARLINTAKLIMRGWKFTRTVVQVCLEAEVRGISLSTSSVGVGGIVLRHGRFYLVVHVIDNGLRDAGKVGFADKVENRITGCIDGCEVGRNRVEPSINRKVASSVK